MSSSGGSTSERPTSRLLWVVGSCETKSPGVLLVVSWEGFAQRLLAVLRTLPHAYPSISVMEKALVLNLFHILNLSDFSFCDQPEKTPCF